MLMQHTYLQKLCVYFILRNEDNQIQSYDEIFMGDSWFESFPTDK